MRVYEITTIKIQNSISEGNPQGDKLQHANKYWKSNRPRVHHCLQNGAQTSLSDAGRFPQEASVSSNEGNM